MLALCKIDGNPKTFYHLIEVRPHIRYHPVQPVNLHNYTNLEIRNEERLDQKG